MWWLHRIYARQAFEVSDRPNDYENGTTQKCSDRSSAKPIFATLVSFWISVDIPSDFFLPSSTIKNEVTFTAYFLTLVPVLWHRAACRRLLGDDEPTPARFTCWLILATWYRPACSNPLAGALSILAVVGRRQSRLVCRLMGIFPTTLINYVPLSGF